jgi:hypothetical protein
MQSQSRHKKEKYQHDAQLHEKHQNQPAELSFVDLKEMRPPRHGRVPEQGRRGKVEQSE